jgi:D-glycerate 3-kinase
MFLDYPSYELFTETLRRGVFAPAVGSANTDWQGRQLRLVVDKSRRVQEVYQI